jgi:hypothetical protein
MIINEIKNYKFRDNGNIIFIGVIFHICYSVIDKNDIDKEIEYTIECINRDFNKKCNNFDCGKDVYKDESLNKTYQEYTKLADTCNIIFYHVDTKYAILLQQTSSNISILDKNIKEKSPPINPEKYLNIWVVDFNNGLLGYAQFPWDINPKTDGVVVAKGVFGRRPEYPEFNLNKTFTHEIGHWLGLYHVFQETFEYQGGLIEEMSEEEMKGDLVADTPPQGEPTYGNPFANPNYWPISKPLDEDKYYRHMFMNFMDYTDDIALFMFTHDQTIKIRQMIHLYRPMLLTNTIQNPTIIKNILSMEQPKLELYSSEIINNKETTIKTEDIKEDENLNTNISINESKETTINNNDENKNEGKEISSNNEDGENLNSNVSITDEKKEDEKINSNEIKSEDTKEDGNLNTNISINESKETTINNNDENKNEGKEISSKNEDGENLNSNVSITDEKKEDTISNDNEETSKSEIQDILLMNKIHINIVYDFGIKIPNIRIINNNFLGTNVKFTKRKSYSGKKCLRTKRDGCIELNIDLHEMREAPNIVISMFIKSKNPRTFIWFKPPSYKKWITYKISNSNKYKQYTFSLPKPYTSKNKNKYLIRLGSDSSSRKCSYFDQISITNLISIIDEHK